MRIWNGNTLLTGNIRAKNDTTFYFCFNRCLLCRGTEFSKSESCLLRNQNKDMSAANGCCIGRGGAGVEHSAIANHLQKIGKKPELYRNFIYTGKVGIDIR
jgi:hypothetical protein